MTMKRWRGDAPATKQVNLVTIGETSSTDWNDPANWSTGSVPSTSGSIFLQAADEPPLNERNETGEVSGDNPTAIEPPNPASEAASAPQGKRQTTSDS